MNVGSNVIWSSAEACFRLGLNFFINVLIARYLGPSDYGVLSAAFVTVNLASAIGGLGMDSIVVRELSSGQFSKRNVLGSALRMRSVAAIAVMLCLLIAAFVSENNILVEESPFWKSCLIMAMLIPFQPFAFGIGASFQSLLKAKLLTTAKIAGLAIASIARIVGLFSGYTIFFFAFCHFLEYIIVTIIGVALYRKEIAPEIGKWKAEPEVTKVLREGMKWLLLSAILVEVISGAGVIMLKGLSTVEQAGVYSAAYRLSIVFQFIPTIVCTTFLPVITQSSTQDPEKTERLENELFRFLWLVGYILAAFFILFGDLVVSILLGHEFSGSSPVLKILALSLIPISVGAARKLYFTKKKEYSKIMLADVAGASLTLILSFVLIPKYQAVGAAVATIISATVGYVIVPFVFLEKNSENSKRILKAGLFPFPNFRYLFTARLS